MRNAQVAADDVQLGVVVVDPVGLHLPVQPEGGQQSREERFGRLDLLVKGHGHGVLFFR